MAVENYVYRNPDLETNEQYPFEFRVDVVDPNDRNLEVIAYNFQRVMAEAWTEQFEGRFTPEQIAHSVNPHDPRLVRAQVDRLAKSNLQGQGPTFVQARFGNSEASTIPDMTRYIAGIGKSLEDKQRLWKPTLADVSNVFVRPEAPGFQLKLQGRGIGSAILRSLLDSFPEDMPTVIYDFPFNTRVIEWLGRLGFNQRKTWSADYFGKKVEQAMLVGPEAGQLAENLERRKPWLAARTHAQ